MHSVRSLYLILGLFFFPSSCLVLSGQNDESFGGLVELDSVVITASKKGFDVDDFIELVRGDESFYQAFRNLRFLSYSFDNQMKFYDKKGKVKASYTSKAKQHSDGNCRTMKIDEESTLGKFWKGKRKYRYYTAKLYDRLFFTQGEICESDRLRTNKGKKKKGMAKHVEELKKLLFKPGEKANVPFIGKKTAIFEPKMHKYYSYKIRSEAYQDSIDCYVFTVAVKPEYLKKKKGKTVIKFLETYFDKRNFQVIARTYQLKHKTAIYDFDVLMDIKLGVLEDQYIPEYIRYHGTWDVSFKKRETATFEMKVFNAEIPKP